MQELKRLVSVKNLLFFVVIIVVNEVLFFNAQYKKDSVISDKECKSVYLEYVDLCSNMSNEEASEYINNEHESAKKAEMT